MVTWLVVLLRSPGLNAADRKEDVVQVRRLLSDLPERRVHHRFDPDWGAAAQSCDTVGRKHHDDHTYCHVVVRYGGTRSSRVEETDHDAGLGRR